MSPCLQKTLTSWIISCLLPHNLTSQAWVPALRSVLGTMTGYAGLRLVAGVWVSGVRTWQFEHKFNTWPERSWLAGVELRLQQLNRKDNLHSLANQPVFEKPRDPIPSYHCLTQALKQMASDKEICVQEESWFMAEFRATVEECSSLNIDRKFDYNNHVIHGLSPAVFHLSTDANSLKFFFFKLSYQLTVLISDPRSETYRRERETERDKERGRENYRQFQYTCKSSTTWLWIHAVKNTWYSALSRGIGWCASVVVFQHALTGAGHRMLQNFHHWCVQCFAFLHSYAMIRSWTLR